MSDNGVQPAPEAIAPPKKETAWERGLKLAKEVRTCTRYYYIVINYTVYY